MFLVLVLYALFAVCYPINKMAFEFYIRPIFFSGLCFFIAGTIHLIYVYITRKKFPSISKKQIAPLATLVICNIYLTAALSQWGLQYLTATKSCFINNLCPFFSAIVSYIWLSEKMTLKKWLGLVIGFIGFIPVFVSSSGSEDIVGGFSIFSWPEIAVTGAALATVIGWISMRKLVMDDFDAVYANGISMLLGSLLLLPTSWIFNEGWHPFPVISWPYAMLFVLLSTFLSYIIAYNLYSWLLSRYSATFITMGGLASPLFTALFSWVLLGEQVGLSFMFSMIMVGLGIFVYHQEELSEDNPS